VIDKIGWNTRDDTGTWEITCDDCNDTQEVEGDFQDCLHFLKTEGWKTVKAGNDWTHFCPECKGEN